MATRGNAWTPPGGDLLNALSARIPSLFLTLAIPLGLAYALLMPPLQVPDEFGHFFRAYDAARGSCLGEANTVLPNRVADMGGTYAGHLEANRRMSLAEIREQLSLPLEPEKSRPVGFLASNLYNCVPYAPASAGILAGRVFEAPALLLMYLARLATLAAYIGLVWLALRLAPEFQLPLLVVALMPMSLHQAASVSADSLTLASGFFFLAYVLHLASTERAEPFGWRDAEYLALAAVFALSCKFSLWLLPMLGLIPACRFASPRRRWLLLGGLALASAGAGLLWQIENQPNLRLLAQQRLARDVDMAANSALLGAHPLAFAGTILRTLDEAGREYFKQMIGRFGYLVVAAPAWVVWLWAALLPAVALVSPVEVARRWTARLLLALCAAAGVCAVFGALWVVEAGRPLQQALVAGTALVPGVQGRYFVPALPAALLALGCRRFGTGRPALTLLAALAICLANLACLASIRAVFY